MRRASGVALCAGAVSLGLHASGLVAFAPERPQALAGGPQQLAMVGNSFEDAVAGRIATFGDDGRDGSRRMCRTGWSPSQP